MKTVKEKFDIFEWDAPAYENFEAIAYELHWLNLCNKKLKAVYIIGDCMEDSEYWERSTWELTVTEPVQLVFEGGISVEFLLYSEQKARIGVNSIPIGVTDGLNNGNIDANSFFKEFIGKELKVINVKSSVLNTSETEHDIEFVFEEDLNLCLNSEGKSRYSISASMGGNNKLGIKKRLKAIKSFDQVTLYSGLASGGVMWIQPIFSVENPDLPKDAFILWMSIEDYDFDTYFRNFAYKHYDETIQDREWFEDNQFDWYGVNYFSRESTILMLKEIKDTAKLYRACYEKPNVLKANFQYLPYGINMDELKLYYDVYERFAMRLERMIGIEGFEMLCITGP